MGPFPPDESMLVLYDIHVLSLILFQVILWEGPVNSIFQLIIIILANVFLAIRLVRLHQPLDFDLGIHLNFSIDTLTKSHLQSGLVVFLSTIAFIGGIINVTSSWRRRWCGCFHAAYLSSC